MISESVLSSHNGDNSMSSLKKVENNKKFKNEDPYY